MVDEWKTGPGLNSNTSSAESAARITRPPAPFGPTRFGGRAQPVRMVDALGVARHFRAHDALRGGMVRRAVHAPDPVPVDHLDVGGADQAADGRASA